jgi:hypothetical protein
MEGVMSQAELAPGLGVTPLPDAIVRLLARPDLAVAPHERSLRFVADLAVPFIVEVGGQVRLGPACLARGEGAAIVLRHALELALLLPRMADAPALAGLAAARVAALAAVSHGAASERWHEVFAAEVMPAAQVLRREWLGLARLQADAPAGISDVTIARLGAAWPLLGPAEVLLQTGGDQRLVVDPATGLNHYGCSHRPRPWAVTFASSTASSSSERGFAGAEAARQGVALAVLAGEADAALAAEAAAIRAAIGAHAGLAEGGAVVLAASGTDCELMALALADAGRGRKLASLLVAPEETGSGVPLAAVGRHFASDTARGDVVEKGALVAGMPRDVTLLRVAARDGAGAMRTPGAVDDECSAVVAEAVASGREVVVHLLDISKTGYLAPQVDAVAAMAARHGDAVLVVVDACQLRLTRARIGAYLARGWVVLVTGSKFLTGPPFAGAVLVPASQVWRLAAALPAGLGAYSSQAEWPEEAGSGTLPARGNFGLLLRWRAALAEWDALQAVPATRTREIVTRFAAAVRQGIAANPDVALLETPAPARPDDGWDGVQTVVGFVVRPEAPLDPLAARRLYHWLNADLRGALPATLSAEEERLACLRCHIGQPVPLAGAAGPVGVLRISAGARLVSGEPSHHDLDEDARLLREIRDALSVLAKVSLILAHWEALAAADPKPSF